MKIFKNKKPILEVEKADSYFSKIKGLMFKSLEEKSGLLMCFEEEDERNIWMPFMKQPLCVVFLDENKTIVGKKKTIPLTLNPNTWKLYSSNVKCKYILESHINRIRDFKIGDKLEWKREI